MAIAYDNLSSIVQVNIANPRTGTITTLGSTNKAMVIGIGLKDGVSVSVNPTIDGAATTSLGNVDLTSSGARIYLFGFVGQAASSTISWSLSDTTEISNVNAITVTGADQTGGTTTFPNFNSASGITSTPSVTITSAVGDLVVNINESGTNTLPTIGGTGTQRLNALQNSKANFALTADGAASVVCSWTGAGTSMNIGWVAAGVSVKQATGTQNQLAWTVA